jgi:molybdopterin converting factor small subunit
MAVVVKVPKPLRDQTGGQADVEAAGTTVLEVFHDIERRHAGIRSRILDDSGEVRRFINIYVNGEDIRFRDGLATPVAPGDEIRIVPAIAGGV